MRPAIENSLERVVVTELEGTSTMVASEAGLVINSIIGGQPINQIHGLLAGHAFLGGSCKGHGFQHLPLARKRKRKRSLFFFFDLLLSLAFSLCVLPLH